MDTKLKKAWIADLRSGDKEQTTGVLHDHNGYCCLGVLLETVARIDYAPIEIDNNLRDAGGVGYFQYRYAGPMTNDDGLYGDDGFDWCDGELDTVMLEVVGMSSDEQRKLVHMNDDDDYTFDAIAEWIEDNL